LFNTALFPQSALRGPARKNVDLTLSKNFKINECWSTELRGEFFNLINHANCDIPGHTLGNADFGMIAAAEPARTVQVAASCFEGERLNHRVEGAGLPRWLE